MRDAKPFTYVDKDGARKGLAIDIWQRVSETLFDPSQPAPTTEELRQMSETDRAARRLSIAFMDCDTIDAQEAAMRAGLADIVISPLTITADRMREYDFSQQYLSSGIALALPQSDAIDFEHAAGTVVETLFQPTVAQAIVLFLGFNLMMAYLVRRLLMSDDPAGFLGIKHLLEAVVRTIGLKGVGDSYTTPIAKLLEIFMAIVGTALSATILGILTTAFVGSVGEGSDVSPAQFTTMRIATLKCSTSQEYLFEQYQALGRRMAQDDPLRPVLKTRLDWLACAENTPITGPSEMSEETGLAGAVVLTRSWPDAVKLLAQKQVDAVLGDWIALSYEARNGPHQNAVSVQRTVYRNEPYGWAIMRRPGSEGVRRSIDSALIAQMRDVSWRSVVTRHLGDGTVSPN